jgi:hypothetical protein
MDFDVPKQTKRLQTAYISDCHSLAQRTQRTQRHATFSIFHFQNSICFRTASLYGAPLIAWQAKEIPRYGCRRNRHGMTVGVECFLLPTSRFLRRASLHGDGCRRNRHGMTLGGVTQRTLRHAACSIFHSPFSIFKTRFAFFQKAC